MKTYSIYFFLLTILSLGVKSCIEKVEGSKIITYSSFEYHRVEIVENRYYQSENMNIVPTGAFAFLPSIDTIIAEILPGIEEEASLVML